MLDQTLVPQLWIYHLDHGTELFFIGEVPLLSRLEATGGLICRCRESRETG